MSGPDPTRDLLSAAGRFEDAPPVDLADGAVARLRGHRRAVGNANELLRIVNHFVAGLARLLGAPPRE